MVLAKNLDCRLSCRWRALLKFCKPMSSRDHLKRPFLSSSNERGCGPGSFGPPLKHEIGKHRLARIVHLAALRACCKDVAQFTA
jgi:hypothetical protein